jgi:hypothetical protein
MIYPACVIAGVVIVGDIDNPVLSENSRNVSSVSRTLHAARS